MLGGMGVDLGDAPVDTRLKDLHVEGARGVHQSIIDSVPGGDPTIEDMVRYRSEQMRLVGAPEQVADALEVAGRRRRGDQPRDPPLASPTVARSRAALRARSTPRRPCPRRGRSAVCARGRRR
jgi:hypothetical protein